MLEFFNSTWLIWAGQANGLQRAGESLVLQGLLFVCVDGLIILIHALTGVVILVLTVPIYFPVALALGVDPIHLGILTALGIEIGSVIPPVGLNLSCGE